MTVHFIGAGPGAADLLTVRAVDLLRSSRVCLYAGTYLDDAVLGHCPADATLIDTQQLNLDQIVEHLVEANAAGHDVARLCSGDPTIYSALAEQTERLDAEGVPWDVTPGVPAYAAAAAVLRAELTVPELVQSVVLTRAQARSTAMPASEALANFAKTRATVVLHLAITRIGEAARDLLPEYGPACPVAVVYRASQPNELVIRGTLADIEDRVAAANLRQAAVIIVGAALEPDRVVRSHLYDPCRVRPTGDDPQ